MTNDKIEECSCDKVEMDASAECPEDKKVDGVCPKMAEASPVDYSAKLDSIVSSVSGLTEKLAGLEKQIGVRETPQPTATIAPETSTLTVGQIAEKMAKAFDEGRDFKVTLPYAEVRNLSVLTSQGPRGVRESMRSSFDRKIRISEAYSLSGTHTAIDQIPGVQTVPGGNDYAPVRQFTNYQEVKKGKDSATFYKKTLPNVVSQTVGTTATQSSMTFTAVNIQPSTISGVYFLVDSDDEEDVPYSVSNEIVDAISQVVVDFENNAILNTASAVGTLTPGLWVNGNTGATITHSDIAGMTLDPSAVGTAMAYLRGQGYLKFGKPILAVHPDNADELKRDSDLVDFVQNGRSEITSSGVLPELYGCSILETTSIATTDNTTNDVNHALMFIPGLSYGSASKRNITVKFHDIPEDNQIGVTANWRFKAGAIDASSIVRLSCAQ
jgi:hypothetical protein